MVEMSRRGSDEDQGGVEARGGHVRLPTAPRRFMREPPRHPHGWFAPLRSAEVRADRPTSLSFMGHELVAFRDERGEAHVIDAICPHLGAHLGYGGEIVGGAVRCPFHKLEFEGSGRCRGAGDHYAPGSARHLRTRTWAARERFGMVFVWHGPDPARPDWAMPLDALGWEGWTEPVTNDGLPMPGVQPLWVAENIADIAHLRTVHCWDLRAVVEPPAEHPDGSYRVVVDVVWRLGARSRSERVRALGRLVSSAFRLEARILNPGIVVAEATLTEEQGGLRIRNVVLVNPVGERDAHLRILVSVSRRFDGPLAQGAARALRVAPEELIARVMLAIGTDDFRSDAVIWRHRRHLDAPRPLRGDGPIVDFRRWSTRFWPDGHAPDAPGAPDESGAGAPPPVVEAPVRVFADERTRWWNWSRTATCLPERAFHPGTRDDLVAIVREARRQGRRVRAVGSGHSWSPLVPTDDFLVFVGRLDAVRLDLSTPGRPRVVAEAGATVRQINDVLEPAGYALPSNVVLESVRIGGLVQTGSHGSGWEARTLSDMVHALDVVTASGEVRTYDADRTPPAVMSAARLALGTFGLLHRVTLDVVPSYRVRQVNAKMPLAQVLAEIEPLVLRHDALDVLWWPFTDRAWVRSVTRTDAQVTARRRHDPNDRRRAAFDVAVSRALYAWLARHPERTPAVCRSLFRLIPETSEVVDLVEAVHFRRGIEDFPVDSIELAIPLAPGFESFRRAWGIATRHVEAFHARGVHGLNVNVDARFIRGSGALLSPAYGNERTCYVGLVTARGTPGWPELSAAILRDWLEIPGARPHWAKALPTEGDLLAGVRRAYAAPIDAFLRIRREEGVDPDGMFVNPFLAQILARDPAEPRAHAVDPDRPEHRPLPA